MTNKLEGVDLSTPPEEQEEEERKVALERK